MSAARTRSRFATRTLATLTLATSLFPTTAMAQKTAPGKATTKTTPAPKAEVTRQPTAKTVAIPVNPNDPVAIINNEVITRAQLADEAIARKGPEILETLIARRLLEQAVRRAKLEVTPEEINNEIDSVARRMAGLSREAWLISLNKERGISPEQYARDIIFPAIALRKLAAGRAQVTDKDIQSAYEATYGDKIRVRIIMTDKLRSAQEIWDGLKKNPNGFEAVARTQSIDQSSASLGGLVGEPITRHAFPLNVSEAAFRQLVDGEPGDKDPSHKPKDGDFTGPIQVAESSYLIIRREGIISTEKKPALDSPNVKKQMHDLIYDVKLKEAMADYYGDLIKASSIENRLAGTTKNANEELDPDSKPDTDRRLMSDPNAAMPQRVSASSRAGAAGAVQSVPNGASSSAAGIPDEEVKRVQNLKTAPAPKN